jgi:hypothetical protein
VERRTAPLPRRKEADVTTNQPAENVRMTPEEERAALAAETRDESTEPADEGIGVHTDADDDSHFTEN